MKNNSSKIDVSVYGWYQKQNYNMPWRESKSPYCIWISEIMLQQTQVKTVKPYYIKWIKKFPTVHDVASAKIDDILKMWEGLGYYKRAHNIYKSAKIIVNNFDGKIPKNYNELISLNGVGDYTASAILSISFNKPYPVFDGNIKRVFSRLYKLKNQHNVNDKAKITLKKCMKRIKPSYINQSFMDLGREICKPQNPSCNICPINFECRAYKTATTHLYPPVIKTKQKPIFNVVVGMVWKNKKLLISKRKKGKLLGGLWELPGGKQNRKENMQQCLKRELLEELNINIEIEKKIGKIKHSYSHFGINMTGYICRFKKSTIKIIEAEEIQWINLKEISKFAFPKATLKLFELYEKNYH